MEPEQVDTLMRAAAQWGAKEQSSLNTALLSLIALLLAVITWGAKSFAHRLYGEVQQALQEIRDIKIDVARHDEAIETLKGH